MAAPVRRRTPAAGSAAESGTPRGSGSPSPTGSPPGSRSIGATRPAPGPRAIRARLSPVTPANGDPVIVVDPDAAEWSGSGGVRLERTDPVHATLVEPAGGGRVPILLGRTGAGAEPGSTVREVVVEGWRFEVVLEPERRAALRERARRGRIDADAGGPLELRAIIPGRIVAVATVPGDEVVAGQQLLVLEAMKMQNELRAPRDGRIERLLVGVGENVEVGDLLLVIT